MGGMAHVESVARAVKIIEELAKSPAGLSETARRVDLPKTTVARLLSTLEDVEAVRFEFGIGFGSERGRLALDDVEILKD